ncbi:MAG: stage V sporulation protein AB [Lachnospiraceae bacterium]|nr:stage V sporulation protein AB [Lachnospiraceae bacterium]
MLPDGKLLALGVLGLSAGGIIAAGVFAFLAIIGVFPRLIGKTKTKRHIILYETFIVMGGIIGNLIDLYEFPIPLGTIAGQAVLLIFGLSAGIFVGCLVMSLAETLNALPVLTRRVHLAVGLQYIILAIALGKLTGSLTFFWYGIGSS